MNGKGLEGRVQIDPWGSGQYQDYARLRDEFGIQPFGAEEWGVFRHPHDLFRRGVVFGHRDFERVADAVRGSDPWSVMTGFMPSGDLHLGHKMLLDQVIAHQAEGADVHLALADFEAMAARGFTQQKARQVAVDQYVRNALALGLRPAGAEFYFQTKRTRVKDLAHQFAQKVNWSTLQALYGFGGETALAHVLAPLVQAADILHVQTDGPGPRPVLVPVGVDQDPHIRLTRDVAQSWRRYSVGVTTGAGVVGAAGSTAPHVFVAVKGSDDVARWLDVAEEVLDQSGVGTRTSRRRNDAHGQIVVGSADQVTAADRRRLEHALGRAEAGQGQLGFVPPSATYHRFMTGLQGGKMSSSRPESNIALTEEPKAALRKMMAAKTGGRDTAEEQRRLGANPDVCPVYESYLYHLARDDAHLQTVYDECRGGKRLCGSCKSEAGVLLVELLRRHRENLDATAHLVDDVLAKE